MAVTTYRAWLARLAPTSLGGKWGSRLVGALGLIGDMVAELCVTAIEARNIVSKNFPPDALRYAGSERMMPRYPVETDANYQARLADAWDTWEQAGTGPAIAQQFAAAGFIAECVQPNNDWNWDDVDEDWSRFWVVVTGHYFEPWSLGDAHTLGDDIVLGSTATSGDVALMRGIERQWKPGHVRCMHIILVFDLDVWNADEPDGGWGNPAARCEEASYIPG